MNAKPVNGVLCAVIGCLYIVFGLVILQAALVYEATAVCTYSAGQKTPFTKHVRIEGIGKCLTDVCHIIASMALRLTGVLFRLKPEWLAFCQDLNSVCN